MVEIRTILCPIDFSEHSRHALDHAVAIARWYGSSVTVLHVYSAVPVAAYAPGGPVLAPVLLTSVDREQLLAGMRRFVDTEAAPGVVPIDTVLREGNTVDEILGQADVLHADLLVIGTHGRSGFQRLVLGSIAEKVLRKATCPVLSVPPRMPDAVPAAPVLFKRILCPVDFSDCSLHALNYAMSLAQEADASLTVLHAMAYDLVDAPDLYETLFSDRQLSGAELGRRHAEACRERLEQAVPETVRAYCRVDTTIASGKPYHAILDTSVEQQSDLIVMGVRGRSPANLMFLGSTTQHVLRQATCPVLTLRTA
jgi:nucleotide-binding universal stress UspA family protein